MRYRPAPLEISAEQPFANDALNLEPAADALTQLISNGKGPGVIAVDASWGFGKSTFLEMWRKSYEAGGGKVVWWNAWENDFVEDVFVSLFEEIGDQITAANPKARAAKGHAKQAAKSLLKHGVPMAIRIATAGLLSGHELEGKGLDQLLESASSDYLDSYLERKQGIKKFREQLQKFVEEQAGDSGGDCLPIAIVVDELDRCRPAFALQALETIKHLFGINGLVFVLGLDLEQLGNAIQGAYGPHFDGKGYLRRLIDVKLGLPEPDIDKFVDALIMRYEISETFSQRTRNWLSTPENLATSLKRFAKLRAMSLRDVEQAMLQINLYLGSIRPGSILFPTLAACLIVMRQKDSGRYDHFFRLANDFDAAWALLLAEFPGLEKTQDDSGQLLELETRVVLGGVDLLDSRLIALGKARTDSDSLSDYDSRLLELGGHLRRMLNNFGVFSSSVSYIRARLDLLHVHER